MNPKPLSDTVTTSDHHQKEVSVKTITDITHLKKNDFNEEELKAFREAPYYHIISFGNTKFAMDKKHVPKRLHRTVTGLFGAYYTDPNEPEFHPIV